MLDLCSRRPDMTNQITMLRYVWLTSKYTLSVRGVTNTNLIQYHPNYCARDYISQEILMWVRLSK